MTLKKRNIHTPTQKNHRKQLPTNFFYINTINWNNYKTTKKVTYATWSPSTGLAARPDEKSNKNHQISNLTVWLKKIENSPLFVLPKRLLVVLRDVISLHRLRHRHHCPFTDRFCGEFEEWSGEFTNSKLKAVSIWNPSSRIWDWGSGEFLDGPTIFPSKSTEKTSIMLQSWHRIF